MKILSAAFLIFLVLDPLGNIPLFVSILGGVEVKKRRRWILLRELIIALAVLVAFLFLGPYLLSLLHISRQSLSIAGGIVLFLIAINMVSGTSASLFSSGTDGEPLLFPLAIPLIAGPSAMATVMLMAAREPENRVLFFSALLCAWAASGVILLSASFFRRVLSDRGLFAVERLMGLILTAVAVEMFLEGLNIFLAAR